MENKAPLERDEIFHELKNSLNVAGGYLDAVIDGIVPDEQVMQYIELVSSEIKRISALLSAQPEGFEKINLKSAFERHIKLMKLMLEKKHIEISLNGEAAISGSNVLIGQLLFNLLENAVKYTEENGRISISIEKKDGLALIAIRNTGNGIPESMLDKVFEKHVTASEDKSGTGIGLYTAKKIVLLHGGTINIVSKENEYTEISAALPIYK